jgi:N-acetylmuramoyl-L-alanine amidase
VNTRPYPEGLNALAPGSLAIGLFALVTLASFAQKATPPPVLNAPHATQSPQPVFVNRMTVVIDAAHGGIDSGSRIGESILEKDVTLTLAFKLRSLLTARGFNVIMTRDADAPSEPGVNGGPPTLDDRAGIANHAHAVACLVLHATGTGTGVHLYGSELDPSAGELTIEPWLTAQAPWVTQSRALEHQLASTLTRATIPLIAGTASVRPVDSLACPALVVELAPQNDDASSINAADYQQSVAQALAAALVFWPNQIQVPMHIPSAVLTTGAQP